MFLYLKKLLAHWSHQALWMAHAAAPNGQK